MNEEIKEILEFKKDADYKRLSVDEIVILEDYIKNLDNMLCAKNTTNKILIIEKKKLQEENKELLDKVRDRDKLIVENIQLKRDRIDKSIEVLKLCNSKCAKETINILRGKDNE